MRVLDRIWRVAASWRGDVIAACGLIAFLLLYLASQGQLRGSDHRLEAGCAVAVFCCVAVRRAHPQLAAIVAAVCLALAGLAGTPADWPGSLILVAVLPLAYSLGAGPGLGRSILVLLLLTAGLQLAIGPRFNPFVYVSAIGPWAVALVVGSRRRLTGQLAIRGRELDAERALFAAEAVRYERARIARELHDIVAHSVSVMVIQASAGQRLTATDPQLAAEAFDSIGEAARQAEAEIGRLVGLLDPGSQQPAVTGIAMIGELVARAGAAGLAVTCRFAGPAEDLGLQSGDAAYRVVQESLTNAFKHAPGAPVDVVITSGNGQVEIGVLNGPAAGSPSGLEHAGGGRGLAGMRERVTACGGDISAGPSADGGWQVLARLPGHSEAAHAGSAG